MNLDELKAAWKVYDSKVASAQQINEKLIAGMIANRSDSRFASVKRKSLFSFAWMFGWLSVAVLICLTNPFDYTMTIQFVPLWIFIACVSVMLVGLMSTYLKLNQIDINHNNIDLALRQIIALYERPQKFLKYTLILLMFSQVFLFPLSFLPKGIERVGFLPALGEALIPISIVALMVYAAYRLGVFKENNRDKFKNDLSELEELKAMSRELTGA